MNSYILGADADTILYWLSLSMEPILADICLVAGAPTTLAKTWSYLAESSSMPYQIEFG
jgi:hypothetical protein